MNKSDLINKLEDAINSFKQEVDKNEGSTLTTIASTITSGVDSLVDAISSNKKAQKVSDTVKKHLNDLESAILKGDKKISASAMSAIQKGVQELKKKLSDGNDAPIYEYTGSPTIKTISNKSKVFMAGKHREAPIANIRKKNATPEKAKTARSASAATAKSTAGKAGSATKAKAETAKAAPKAGVDKKTYTSASAVKKTARKTQNKE